MNLLTDGITIGAVRKTDRATKMTVDGLTDVPPHQIQIQ